jgi:DNA-binding transcriptional ArsR family regulator
VTPLEAAIVHLAAAFSGHVDGDVVWTRVASNLDLDGKRIEPENDILHVEGTLATEGRATEAGIEWRITGTVERLSIDTALVWAAVGVGSATALLAALGQYLLHAVRAFATLVLGRNAPRGLKMAPLASAARVRILRTIHVLQAPNLTDLARQTGLSRGTLRYHLRILLANEILQVHRALDRPKLAVYSLNSSSLDIPLHGGSDTRDVDDPTRPRPTAADALAAILTHSIRRRAFEILEEKPLTMSELRTQLCLLGPGRPALSSVKEHLKHLVACGAVRRGGPSKRPTYQTTLDLDETFAHQYRRFLAQTGLLETFSSIVTRSTPVAAPGHERRASERGGDTRLVRHLLDLGIVTEARPGILQPAPGIARVASRIVEPI